MQLFSADATIFIRKKKNAHKKFKKNTLKSCSEKLKSTFFPYCPELPKQKNSCSKMWLIDQLYIKLGLSPFVVLSRPGVPPVLVLNKMFPDLPRKTAETLSIIEYEELLVASKTALEERELALNASAASRITTVRGHTLITVTRFCLFSTK